MSPSLLYSRAGVGAIRQDRPVAGSLPLSTAPESKRCQEEIRVPIVGVLLLLCQFISILPLGGETLLSRAPLRVPPVDGKGIGERLKDIRKRRGKTQTEVAEALGVDQSLISAYERGAVRPNAASLVALARLLRTSADEILGLKEMKPDAVFTDRRFIRRMQRIDRLPKRAKDALLKTIDTYLDGVEKR